MTLIVTDEIRISMELSMPYCSANNREWVASCLFKARILKLDKLSKLIRDSAFLPISFFSKQQSNLAMFS